MCIKSAFLSISSLAIAIALVGCGGTGTDPTSPTAGNRTDERRAALIQQANTDEDYKKQADELTSAGLSVDMENARYEQVEASSNPETGQNVGSLEKLVVPVKDQSQVELASVVYAVSSSGEKGVVVDHSENDADGTKLKTVLNTLDASAMQAQETKDVLDAAGLGDNGTSIGVFGLAKASKGCYPWQCKFASKRIWTWECVGRVSGGWALVPATVSGYSEYSDHRDFTWFADYSGRGIACPSHNSGKKEGRRVCCKSLPCR